MDRYIPHPNKLDNKEKPNFKVGDYFWTFDGYEMERIKVFHVIHYNDGWQYGVSDSNNDCFNIVPKKFPMFILNMGLFIDEMVNL